jgi:hypothetical protein
MSNLSNFTALCSKNENKNMTLTKSTCNQRCNQIRNYNCNNEKSLPRFFNRWQHTSSWSNFTVSCRKKENDPAIYDNKVTVSIDLGSSFFANF